MHLPGSLSSQDCKQSLVTGNATCADSRRETSEVNPSIGSKGKPSVVLGCAIIRTVGGCEDQMTDRSQVSVDLEKLRARLKEMSDKELRAFGTAAQKMCSPKGSLGKPLGEESAIQLEEALAEWKRRKSKSVSK